MKLSAILLIFLATTAIAQDSIFAPGTSRFPYTKMEPAVEAPFRLSDGPEGLIGPTTYQFSALSGIPLEDMSGSTQLLGGGSGSDNVDSALAQIGFLYRFDGAFYTSFGINANGLLRLGNITVPPHFTNTLDSALNSPKVAPYWNDLCISSSGNVRYKMVPGPVGVQKLVVEWRRVYNRGEFCGFDGTLGTFQLWLYDRTGVIQFVYGNPMGQNSAGYSIGIQSGAATNFASINASANSVSYTTANNNQTSNIVSGTSYRLSPNIPAAVTGLAATPGQTAVTVNWTDNANDETGYLVRRTTDHINFYFVGLIPANSTTFTDTDLTTSTQYSYYVNALTDGAFGPDVLVGTTTLPAQTFTSAAAGGLWSSPATWAGNLVPDAGDDVVIADGATVVIDTVAEARSITVGSPAARPGDKAEERDAEGGAPAALRFAETTAFSLMVTNDISVSSNGTLSTGGGNANQHVLTVRGNIINNGVFDLSTNNNQAGAGLVFTGSTSNTFSGTGPVTDIRTITIDKGVSSNNVLEVSVANFTVQGSASDGPDAGYLYLVNGTYKISGTFTANFRTFPNPNYQIPSTTGFTLNNPNYTVTAQHSASVPVIGKLRVSAGTFNVGTVINDSMVLLEGSNTVIEGGKVNTAGAFKTQSNGSAPFSYTQTGGTVTTCMMPGSTTCYSIVPSGVAGDTISIQGGEGVVQNNGQAVIGNAVDMTGSAAVVRLGNESTVQPATFGLSGDDFPDVILDTRTGGHVLRVTPSLRVRNLEIGIGGYLDLRTIMNITGESFVNNGLVIAGGGKIIWSGQNPVYSGIGLTEVVNENELRCQSLTLASVNSFRVRTMWMITGDLIHSEKLIIGNNDAIGTTIGFGQAMSSITGGTFDTSPVFETGTGVQSVFYSGNGPDRSTGVEINPSRKLHVLAFYNMASGARLNITGGDLTVDRLNLSAGEVVTGQYKIIHTGTTGTGQGFVSGEIERKFTFAEGYTYPFAPGTDPAGQIFVNPSAVTINPSYLSIRKLPGAMPGLLPATSASTHWRLTETGDITASVRFSWLNSEIRGNEANYALWRSTGGGPFATPWTNRDIAANTIQTVTGTTDFTGFWGIGEMADPGPISVSGSVLTSGGAGIRNAIVTISGGNLPSPVSAQTGQFGTYNFTGLLAGEIYTVTVSAKRFRFSTSSRQVTPFGNLTGVDFTANPTEEF